MHSLLEVFCDVDDFWVLSSYGTRVSDSPA